MSSPGNDDAVDLPQQVESCRIKLAKGHKGNSRGQPTFAWINDQVVYTMVPSACADALPRA